MLGMSTKKTDITYNQCNNFSHQNGSRDQSNSHSNLSS